MVKTKTVRVSSKTNPKQLATSLIYSLDEGYQVKAIAIGESIKTLAKALAMINLFSRDSKYDFQPMLEYMKDDSDIFKNVLTWTIRKSE